MILLLGEGCGRNLECQDNFHPCLFVLVHPHPAVMGEVFVTGNLYSLSILALQRWCL